MADFSGPWTGSQDQVQLVSNTFHTTFVMNQPITGPYTYDAASNNLWVNSKGQSAALLYANVQRYGVDYAVQQYNAENAANAPTPAYTISVAANQPTVSSHTGTVSTTNVPVSANVNPMVANAPQSTNGSYQVQSNAGSISTVTGNMTPQSGIPSANAAQAVLPSVIESSSGTIGGIPTWALLAAMGVIAVIVFKK